MQPTPQEEGSESETSESEPPWEFPVAQSLSVAQVSGQVPGVRLTQDPEAHVPDVVQGSPSSHPAPFGLIETMQIPRMQTSSVQGFPSPQSAEESHSGHLPAEGG